MSSNLRVSLTVVAVVVAIVGALVLLNRPDGSSGAAAREQPDASVPASVLVRPDSHRLSTGDGKVTVVEFLDLECPACGAAFPVVERLRAEYGDRVTFVIRHFPIPGHRNAEPAARSVEAAAEQGALEGMYRKLFETQRQWGGQQAAQRETFVGFARELGLDVAKFERDLDDPAIAERVARDRADGTEVGVKGTPTFFVNGSRTAADGLESVIDEELGG